MIRPFVVLAAACLVLGCSVPGFEYESAESVVANACRDGLMSPGEADVDCGRACSSRCASGLACDADADCASDFCSAGSCQDPSCTDALKNQDETDVDCGGDMGCARCVPGKACGSAADCDGGACKQGKCRAASCDDGLSNQTESDVDCGGECPPCANGKSCRAATDCNLTLCTGGKCRPASCSDGIENQNETDLDCGGDTGCAPCATGQHCAADADCNHTHCSKASCQPTSCSDAIQNGSETDVDCGGSCEACADLAGCSVSKDCVSSVCTTTTHRCAAPSCHDGVLNGSEPSIDCGASCSKQCLVADACALDADCATGNCTGLHCVPVATGAPLLATGWLGTASHTYAPETPPRYALDGDPGTHWTNGAPQVPGMWFLVDMIKPQVFFSITLTSNSQPTDYAKTLRLSGSADGVTFTELRTGIAGDQSLKISFIDPQYARYLKLELLEATNGFWWRIDDLIVLQ